MPWGLTLKPVASLWMVAPVLAFFATPGFADAIDRVMAGLWTGPGGICEENTYCYRAEDNRHRLIAVTSADVQSRVGTGHEFGYDVLKVTDDAILMALDNETIMGPDGNPVTWVLVFLDDETYVWSRSDWPSGASTKPSRRCDQQG